MTTRHLPLVCLLLLGAAAAAEETGETLEAGKAYALSFAAGGAGSAVIVDALTTRFDFQKGPADTLVQAENSPVLGDCDLSVTIQSTAGPANYGNGVYLRGEGQSALVINLTGDGRCAVYNYNNGEFAWYRIVPNQPDTKQPFPAIRRGAANDLHVALRGTRLHISVNDTEIGDFGVQIRPRGTVGVFLSAGNQVEYRNFRVTPADGSALAPQAMVAVEAAPQPAANAPAPQPAANAPAAKPSGPRRPSAVAADPVTQALYCCDLGRGEADGAIWRLGDNGQPRGDAALVPAAGETPLAKPATLAFCANQLWVPQGTALVAFDPVDGKRQRTVELAAALAGVEKPALGRLYRDPDQPRRLLVLAAEAPLLISVDLGQQPPAVSGQKLPRNFVSLARWSPSTLLVLALGHEKPQQLHLGQDDPTGPHPGWPTDEWLDIAVGPNQALVTACTETQVWVGTPMKPPHALAAKFSHIGQPCLLAEQRLLVVPDLGTDKVVVVDLEGP